MPASVPPILLLQPTADADGVRVAESTGPLVRVLDVPRPAVTAVLGWAELQQPGLVLLAGADGELVALIRTTTLAAALEAAAHRAEPWTRAALVTGRYGSLPVAELASREYWLRLALDYPDEVRAQGGVYLQSEPAAWPALPVEGGAWAASALRLLRALGHAFRAAPAPATASPPPAAADEDRFTLRVGPDTAEGRWSASGFVILQGSAGRAASAGSPERARQDALVAQGVVTHLDTHLVFVRDHRCDSAGEAASLLLGQSSTGFFAWKRPNGQTLAQVLPLPERA